MSKKLELLNGLDKFKDQRHFQEFIIEMGISHHIVHVPLKEATQFEKAAHRDRPSTMRQLKSLVEQFNGTVEE